MSGECENSRQPEPVETRVMALDVGDRRIGVAVSDPTRLLARTLQVIQRGQGERDLATIADLVAAYGVVTIVIGYPRHLKGHAGEQARRVEEYANALTSYLRERSQRSSLPEVEIIFWDERFSTVTAEEILAQTSRKGRPRRSDLDAVAAAVILQDYLDAQRLSVHKPGFSQKPGL